MAISLKALEAAFSMYVGREHEETEGKLESLRDALVRHDNGQCTRSEVLTLANTVIGGHGIESIQATGDTNTIALYVNTGDTYSVTLLYDCRARRFKITTWGDFYERTPEYRRYREI